MKFCWTYLELIGGEVVRNVLDEQVVELALWHRRIALNYPSFCWALEQRYFEFTLIVDVSVHLNKHN